MRLLTALCCALWLALPARPVVAETGLDQPPRVDVFGERLDISFREVEIAEAVELLSRRGKRNIILSDGIKGTITVNLFNVTVEEAVRIIAEGAGHAVEFRDRTFFIIRRDDVGKFSQGGIMEVKAFGIQYSDVNVVSNIVKEQLSKFGNVTVLPGRGMLVVRDRPDFMRAIEHVIRAVDREPQQILIEARILEITLDDTQAVGVDWAKAVTSGKTVFNDAGAGQVLTQNFATTVGPGLFFNFFTPELGVLLSALETKGRLRTLSTPTLLAVENQESNVIIGDRLGYQVTTTINNVTTESVEFLDSGVILRVTPSVDRDDRVLLKVHPQVSTGVIAAGIPSLSTTEVTTTLLIPDGQTTFIGGLIRQNISENRDGVPYLSDIPLIGGLFGAEEKTNLRTETVVLITPYIVRDGIPPGNQEQVDKALENKRILEGEAERINEIINESRSGWLHPRNPSAPAVPDELLPDMMPPLDPAFAPGTAPPPPDAAAPATRPMTRQQQQQLDADIEALQRRLAEDS